jgi:hypothetical protein
MYMAGTMVGANKAAGSPVAKEIFQIPIPWLREVSPDLKTKASRPSGDRRLKFNFFLGTYRICIFYKVALRILAGPV